ncbi:MAG TPA: purine-nucleoside phosphorylase [Actinomycetota bacterium]|nr:purine-nucleoside phosphorylase [Actinomycetota bacterium]
MTVGPGDGLADGSVEAIRRVTGTVPRAAVILGSGLGRAVGGIDAEVEIPYTDLSGFPEPTVPGHVGRLIVGRLAGVPVAAFLGRIHFYEGRDMELVTLPTRVAAGLGAEVLIATAAVGGLDPSLPGGSLVVGEDHLSFLGQNPLRGWRDDDGRPPFVNPAAAYDRDLAEAALKAAADIGLPATRGVYAASAGPTYETPAEIEYLRRAGATVVGMSVVPEVSASAALGLRFVGLYCVTNTAGPGTTHVEVEEVAAAFAGKLAGVLERVLAEI